MQVEIRRVKKHDEVWIIDPDNGECRVKVCTGNSNYGRLYYMPSDEYGYFLSDEDSKEAWKLFEQIWEKYKDYDPFNNNY